MKTLATVITAGIMFCMMYCTKTPEKGSMVVKLTDNPAAFTEVNVEILSVDANYSDNNPNWMPIPTHAGIYNLINLRNNLSVVLAEDEGMFPGNIIQLRMLLGDHNTISAGPASYPLQLAGNHEIIIYLDVNVEPSKRTQIILDFDAEKSIIIGSDSYLLKPVIKAL